MKTKYSHFEIEHKLSEERILMPYVTSSKWTESAAVTDLPELLKNINFVFILTCVSSYTGIINIDQDLISSQAWVNCDFLAFLGGGVYSKGAFIRGGVYFKIRDFWGAFIQGGVYSRRGVYSRKYGIHGVLKNARIFQVVWIDNYDNALYNESNLSILLPMAAHGKSNVAYIFGTLYLNGTRHPNKKFSPKNRLSSYWLAWVSIRVNGKPKARRNTPPKGGHYEGRGLWIWLYGYASQFVKTLSLD